MEAGRFAVKFLQSDFLSSAEWGIDVLARGCRHLARRFVAPCEFTIGSSQCQCQQADFSWRARLFPENSSTRIGSILKGSPIKHLSNASPAIVRRPRTETATGSFFSSPFLAKFEKLAISSTALIVSCIRVARKTASYWFDLCSQRVAGGTRIANICALNHLVPLWNGVLKRGVCESANFALQPRKKERRSAGKSKSRRRHVRGALFTGDQNTGTLFAGEKDRFQR